MELLSALFFIIMLVIVSGIIICWLLVMFCFWMIAKITSFFKSDL